MPRLRQQGLRGALIGSNAGAGGQFQVAVDTADRVDQEYVCGCGYSQVLPMAADVTAPQVWPCTRCAALAVHVDAVTNGDATSPLVGTRPVSRAKTERDYLWERRSQQDADLALQEALTELREQSGSYSPDALLPTASRSRWP